MIQRVEAADFVRNLSAESTKPLRNWERRWWPSPSVAWKIPVIAF